MSIKRNGNEYNCPDRFVFLHTQSQNGGSDHWVLSINWLPLFLKPMVTNYKYDMQAATADKLIINLEIKL